MRQPFVPVLPLQKIYFKALQEGFTRSELARSCGFSGVHAIQNLERTLGLSPMTPHPKQARPFREKVTMNMAVRLVEGMHRDPVDAGF